MHLPIAKLNVKQLFPLRGVAFSLHSSAVEAGTGKAAACIEKDIFLFYTINRVQSFFLHMCLRVRNFY